LNKKNFFQQLCIKNFNYFYEHFNYSSDWYARETDAGTSLEKINPNFNGQISNHWAASVDPSGSTPG